MDTLLVSWHQDGYIVPLNGSNIFQAAMLLSWLDMPIVFVPHTLVEQDWIPEEPLRFGYEMAYFSGTKEIYEYLERAFGIPLNYQEAYLLTEVPLTIRSLGKVSQYGEWLDKLEESVAKARQNIGERPLGKSWSHDFDQEVQREDYDFLGSIKPFEDC